MNPNPSEPSETRRRTASESVRTPAEAIPLELLDSELVAIGNGIFSGAIAQQIRARSPAYLEDKRIQGLMIALDAERRAGFPSGPAFLESIGLAITSALQQDHVASFNKPRELRGGLAPFRLRRVLALIAANLERGITLKDLAHAAGLSVPHFSRMSRTATSLSPHQFVLQQRIEKAGDLILRSD